MANATYLLLVTGTALSSVAIWRSGPQKLNRQHCQVILLSIIATTVILGAWDWYATSQGHWEFNQRFITGIYFGRLPIEEWLFFLAVPLASLSLWFQLLPHKHFPQKFNYGKQWTIAWIAASLITLVSFSGQSYTVMACLAAMLTGFLLLIRQTYAHQAWWWYQLLILGLFIIFNTLLTALPIVTYNPAVISQIRLGTIPIEDFLFHFTMVNLPFVLLPRRLYNQSGENER